MGTDEGSSLCSIPCARDKRFGEVQELKSTISQVYDVRCCVGSQYHIADVNHDVSLRLGVSQNIA